MHQAAQVAARPHADVAAPAARTHRNRTQPASKSHNTNKSINSAINAACTHQCIQLQNACCSVDTVRSTFNRMFCFIKERVARLIEARTHVSTERFHAISAKVDHVRYAYCTARHLRVVIAIFLCTSIRIRYWFDY